MMVYSEAGWGPRSTKWKTEKCYAEQWGSSDQ